MEIKIKKKPFKQEDILRELELADRNCQRYFDRMYKILEFTFAAIIAIVSVGFGFYTKDKVDDFVSYLFLYVIPVCMYVFGVLYLYNGYALSVYGLSAEILHSKIYETKGSRQKEFDKCMRNYVLTLPSLTVLSYGLTVVFFVLFPRASIWFGASDIFVSSDTLNRHIIIAKVWYYIYVVVAAILVGVIIHNKFIKLRNIKKCNN